MKVRLFYFDMNVLVSLNHLASNIEFCMSFPF